MSSASVLRLLLLAAIWGASFLFMRIAAPVLGAVTLAQWRVALAAAFLLAVALALRRALPLRGHLRHYLVLGAINSALPFVLFNHAARTLPASLLAILNATAPIFGAVVMALVARQMPAARTVAGLVVGVSGVALLVGAQPVSAPGAGIAVASALGAALCYGASSTYAKRVAGPGDAFHNAHGSMWGATLVLAPLALAAPPLPAVGAGVALAVAVLGVVCTGVAYLLYFQLIRDEGPTRALTVTFLIPLFGALWGVLFLGESVGLRQAAGMAVVLFGTALTTGLSWQALRGARGEATP